MSTIRAAAELPAIPLEPPQQHEGDQGVEQVELLLDGEAPEVQHRRRRCEQVGVGLPGDDEPPVGHVEQGGGDVAPEVALLDGAGREDAEGQHDHEGSEAGRHQSSEPSAPERPQVHRAGGGALGQQQRGDQEAGEREEGGDAEVAADRPGEPAVEEEHRDDGDASQPVEAGEVGELRARRGSGAGAAGGATVSEPWVWARARSRSGGAGATVAARAPSATARPTGHPTGDRGDLGTEVALHDEIGRGGREAAGRRIDGGSAVGGDPR